MIYFTSGLEWLDLTKSCRKSRAKKYKGEKPKCVLVSLFCKGLKSDSVYQFELFAQNKVTKVSASY